MSSGKYQPSSSLDDAEKPFWISYADLMTALMILFLVIMVTALSNISAKTQEVMKQSEKVETVIENQEVRQSEIESVCDFLAERTAESLRGVYVDCKLNRINFGEVGRFKTDEFKLGADGVEALEGMVPLILEAAETPLGKKWLKQILIEGFTDTDGSYLYNLNLSLKRSEWVMCTLLQNEHASNVNLTAEQRRQIKKLFLAGGVAFNNSRESKGASRRVELRLQFYGLDSEEGVNRTNEAKFDDIGPERCMI
ncbi:flagellar motor protein MotB [Limnobacter parvus]|uniref:OmpA-like domain-containing protein n=1 Tax=Limnobacter parvus TaxID=2939690 RepID=A0ABT1XIY6_9BURK|nr:flagellar motor protein MotB [Limnobacter parvus]MCR2747245.1 hypothetical protein [Limnobacter parvus]